MGRVTWCLCSLSISLFFPTLLFMLFSFIFLRFFYLSPTCPSRLFIVLAVFFYWCLILKRSYVVSQVFSPYSLHFVTNLSTFFITSLHILIRLLFIPAFSVISLEKPCIFPCIYFAISATCHQSSFTYLTFYRYSHLSFKPFRMLFHRVSLLPLVILSFLMHSSDTLSLLHCII